MCNLLISNLYWNIIPCSLVWYLYPISLLGAVTFLKQRRELRTSTDVRLLSGEVSYTAGNHLCTVELMHSPNASINWSNIISFSDNKYSFHACLDDMGSWHKRLPYLCTIALPVCSKQQYYNCSKRELKFCQSRWLMWIQNFWFNFWLIA